MRLLTFRTANGTRAARLEDDHVVELAFDDVGALLASGPNWTEAARAAGGAAHDLAEVDFAPLVLAPPAIVCVGQNYAAHAAETGSAVPSYPTLFAKFASALVGAHDDIILPAVSSQVDWEVELAFVVGSSGRSLSAEDASATIAGYSVANDVSMRDWQGRTSQFLQGKAFEASTPVGPYLVTPDELPGGSAEDLRLTCEVDGVTMQDGRTSDLIFGPATIAAYISQFMTLLPGTVVLTGTPSGVGVARSPQVFLSDGQVVRTTVEGLGTLENRCVAGK